MKLSIRQKKTFLRVVAVSLLVLPLTGCGSGRYEPYRELLRREVALMRDFNAAAGEASDAAGLKRALQSLNEGLARLSAELSQLRAERPDLLSLTTPPAELQKEFDDLGLALRGLDQALLLKDQFFADPDVKAEVDKMIDLQAGLDM